jgi:hypothetical protein
VSAWPISVQAKVDNALIAVAEAPPHKFKGGGYWEAMHGDMAGYYEIRVIGPGRRHYRVFCLLDSKGEGRRPMLVVLAALDKANATKLSDRDYRRVRDLGDEYLRRNPRSVV